MKGVVKLRKKIEKKQKRTARQIARCKKAKLALTNEEYAGEKGKKLDKRIEDLRWVDYYLTETMSMLLELEASCA